MDCLDGEEDEDPHVAASDAGLAVSEVCETSENIYSEEQVDRLSVCSAIQPVPCFFVRLKVAVQVHFSRHMCFLQYSLLKCV